MADIASPQNTASQSLDAVVSTAAATPYLKRGLHPQTASGVDDQVADQAVGTHVDDAAMGIATDSVVAIGGLADETSPDSVNEGDIGALRMTLARNLHTVSVADTATLSQVNSSASSGTILAANANRIGVIVHNTDANDLYLAFTSSAATTSAFSVKIASGVTYEMAPPIYRGQITGIWSADGSGAAVITELT